MNDSTIHHRIRLSDIPEQRELEEVLLACEGVLQVSVREQLLDIRYDCQIILWQDIEHLLQQHQVAPAAGLLNRLKRCWFRFSDQNIRDSANHQAACCNKPPRQP
ncbi:MAG: hypothetical protein V7731_18985 [Amphritea sp.]